MMKPGSVWGNCKYRDLFPVYFGRIQRSNWHYICKKTGNFCDPHYCLGPDEDYILEEKGDTSERKDT